MKRFALALTAVFLAAHAQAGSFGGPPPFTNGSPLPSGVDGSYQANLRGENTNGIVRWRYSGGNQTSDATNNSYVIFTEGLVFSGPAAVNMTESTITGVLDRDTDQAFINTRMTGFFNARADQKSPVYSFRGKGLIETFIETTLGSGSFEALFSRDVKVKGVRVSQTQ